MYLGVETVADGSVVAFEKCVLASGELGNGNKVMSEVWSRDGVGNLNSRGC